MARQLTSKLWYPLSPIPLSLCNEDGTMQKTNKKDLYHILKNLMTQQETPEVIMGNTAFIVDLLTVMHTLQGISGMFKCFLLVSVQICEVPIVQLQADYGKYLFSRFNIIFRKSKIQYNLHGRSSKILIRSIKSKIPTDLALNDSTIFEVMKINRVRMMINVFVKKLF